MGDPAARPSSLVSYACYVQPGVTGALPASFTMGKGQYRQQAPRVGYRYS